MQFTFFSFLMSLLCFNLYIVLINTFRKRDSFIISFSTFPLIFFLFLSLSRLIFNFEIPGAIIIQSKIFLPKLFDFLRRSLSLKGFDIKIFQILVFLWMSVALILLLKSTLDYRKLKKSLEKLENISSKEDKKIFHQILKQTGREDKIEIIQSPNISSPFILGIWKARIYMPDIDFSKEELEYITLHEINHFLGRDPLKKILIQAIKYIFWWNPWSHLFANNFNHILEIQCDLKTTAGFSKEKKIEYLESITKIIKSSMDSDIENLKHSSLPAFADIDQLTGLKQRFRITLNYKAKKSGIKLLRIGVCLLALVINISSYFFILQPFYSPDGQDSFLSPQELDLDMEDTFIIRNEAGKHELYRDNTFQYIIDDIDNEEYKDIPLY